MRIIALLAALTLVWGCGGGKSQSSTSNNANTMSNSNSMSSTASRSMSKPRCKSGDPVVWVNTNSHVYHLQGSKYYGTTKEGKYECKTAADTEGDHQAKNEAPGAASMSSTASKHHH